MVASIQNAIRVQNKATVRSGKQCGEGSAAALAEVGRRGAGGWGQGCSERTGQGPQGGGWGEKTPWEGRILWNTAEDPRGST